MSDLSAWEARPRKASLWVVQSRYHASGSAEWQPTEAEGFWIKSLFFEDAMRPRRRDHEGRSRHPDDAYASGLFQHLYVLQGSFYDQDRTLGPGDFCCRAPDAAHEAGSKEGAIVLLVYTRR